MLLPELNQLKLLFIECTPEFETLGSSHIWQETIYVFEQKMIMQQEITYFREFRISQQWRYFPAGWMVKVKITVKSQQLA